MIDKSVEVSFKKFVDAFQDASETELKKIVDMYCEKQSSIPTSTLLLLEKYTFSLQTSVIEKFFGEIENRKEMEADFLFTILSEAFKAESKNNKKEE